MSGDVRRQRSRDARLPRGLPEQLPDGERLLWQGAPDWRMLARQVFRIRGLALYFAVAVAYYFGSTILNGTAPADAALSTARLAGIAMVPISFLAGYSWLVSRSTVYTITNQRVVIQLGLALPMTINLPFGKIETAAIKPRVNGFGDISLLLNSRDKLAYLVLWPHARPWRMARPEPTFRAIADVGSVAQVLARALAASADMPVPALPETQHDKKTAEVAGSQRPVAA